jgi:hypothetical protein
MMDAKLVRRVQGGYSPKAESGALLPTGLPDHTDDELDAMRATYKANQARHRDSRGVKKVRGGPPEDPTGMDQRIPPDFITPGSTAAPSAAGGSTRPRTTVPDDH